MEEIKLNLGGGFTGIKGWYNIDICKDYYLNHFPKIILAITYLLTNYTGTP